MTTNVTADAERFEIHTTLRKGWRDIADFYQTAIFDRETGNAVSSAADTPAESFKNALIYLLAQNALSASRWRQQLATNDPTPELAQVRSSIA
jgi:hypothetical protein